MLVSRQIALLLLFCSIGGCSVRPAAVPPSAPLGPGPYAVASTNLRVAPAYASIGDDAMHEILLGRPDTYDGPRFLTDILEHRDAAWVIDVAVPDDRDLYGPASGRTLSVVAYLTFPTIGEAREHSYAFPYHDAQYGAFKNMLSPGESPRFADPDVRYPLIVLAHGSSAHGLYDVRRAHNLASHGYIVAVITYGDDRIARPDDPNHHVSFLRPLMTRAVVDAVLESEAFGAHVDTDNIGISGHSFGGFTALTVAGGPYLGNPATVRDERIKAGVLAAPWVGNEEDGQAVFAFGADNRDLRRVTIPMLCVFGTKDVVTPASYILPAMRRLSGPVYVVELVDQPHVFEAGSWEDRDNWELLFFSAYLKGDPASLAALAGAGSMAGGNRDVQLFDYQRADPSIR